MPKPIVTDVAELVEATSLAGIDSYFLHAKRDLDASPDRAQTIAPEYSLFIDFNTEGEEFRVRFETHIALGEGEIGCGVLSRYSYHDVKLRPESSEALTEFVNGVALMHLLPYVRQTISDLTARTFGSALLMPIIQRGQITFELEMDGNDLEGVNPVD